MAPIMALSIIVQLIVIGSNITENQAMVTKKLQTDAQESNKKDRESDELQILAKNAGIGRESARSLPNQMEMIDQKRKPKPRHPMGNDIGTARLLHPTSAMQAKALPANLAAPDHLEATVSVDFIMAASNTTAFKDKETAVVSRQLHEIIDSVPTLPTIKIPHMQFFKDPEEEALNQRITEVARQLTETALRKEYEEGILGHVLRLPSDEVEQTTNNNKNLAGDGKFSGKIPKRIAHEGTEVKRTEGNGDKRDKSLKAGRSFFVANTSPLVSQLSHEAAPLQLISEVQSMPHYLVHEGFHPRTPPPELTGPLLGGPPLKPEDGGPRMAKNIEFDNEKSGSAYLAMRFPTFLKLMSTNNGLNPNTLVMNVPVNGGPTIITTSD